MSSYRWAIEVSTASLAKLADQLYGYFRKRVGNSGDAEDLVGQTWLAAGRNYQGRAPLHIYLFSVAKRLVWDYWRRSRYRPWFNAERDDPETLTSEQPGQDTSLERSEDLERLSHALAQLPEHFAVVIELALLGYGHPQIAEITEGPPALILRSPAHQAVHRHRYDPPSTIPRTPKAPINDLRTPSPGAEG